jgi:hypothetical protein
VSDIAPCVLCTNETCSAVVILPAIPDGGRRFDRRASFLEIDCPSCGQTFSMSSDKIFLYEVTDDDLLAGYVVQ